MLKILAIICISVVFSFAANANTMTFSGSSLDSVPHTQYDEDGITAIGDGWIADENGLSGVAHIDDRGTSSSSGITFTMSGRFDAIGFDLAPVENNADQVYDNLELIGYRGGGIVAQHTQVTGDLPFHYAFAALFMNLDSLYIGILSPVIPVTGCEDLGQPCSHFEIDNIELNISTIPLPAGFPIFAAGLGIVALLRHVRKTRHTA